MKILLSLLSLSYPVWGTWLVIQFITNIKNNELGNLIAIVGILLVGVSSAPIFMSKDLGIVAKVVIALLYFFVSALIIFVFGVILGCLHRCN